MIAELQLSTQPQFAIHPATRPGHVHLSVANLDRQVEFYQKVIGLKLHWRKDVTAGLGVGNADLLRLTEARSGRRYRGTTGLYHFAILLPNRRELARAIGRLLALRYPNYPTDHVMTKTTYLDDPEGNNLELYTESPEDGTMAIVNGSAVVRRADGTPSDGREPLDLEALFRELTTEDQLDEPMPRETRIGHYHLYVADLDQTMRFYHDVLGFDNMGVARAFRMGMVSVAGYHHHIGFNTWVGEGAPPPPPDALGLRYFSFVLPNKAELEHVVERVQQAGIAAEHTEDGILIRDPSQNTVLLTYHSDVPVTK
ncbi:MAG TPA: VOC family protein [Anaerolineae bacterium]|nr:VOC family protein [Anaerolineae bacterium]